MAPTQPKAKKIKKTRASSFSINTYIQKNIHAIAYTSILVVVGGVIFIGSRISQEEAKPAVARVGEYTAVATLDEVSAADVAATIARDANLLIANNVRNKADSLTAQTEFAAAEGTYLDKPQLVATDAKTSKDIIEYTAVEGDTLDTIARKFNVTTDTIKWENDITGTEVSAGRVLTIPPISGVVYTVAAGDTAKSIAEKFSANTEQILAFNDAEIAGLLNGQRIIVPDGKKPAPAPVYVARGPVAVRSTGFSFGSTPLYGGNGYSYGYCTWHAANRRLALGLPMPRNLGNAVTWAALGARAGMGVSGTPTAGAILWHKNTYIAGGLGHVAFVEAVNPDGSISVSDMNYPYWGTVTYRTVSAAETGGYLYIN